MSFAGTTLCWSKTNPSTPKRVHMDRWTLNVMYGSIKIPFKRSIYGFSSNSSKRTIYVPLTCSKFSNNFRQFFFTLIFAYVVFTGIMILNHKLRKSWKIVASHYTENKTSSQKRQLVISEQRALKIQTTNK